MIEERGKEREREKRGEWGEDNGWQKEETGEWWNGSGIRETEREREDGERRAKRAGEERRNEGRLTGRRGEGGRKGETRREQREREGEILQASLILQAPGIRSFLYRSIGISGELKKKLIIVLMNFLINT